MPLTFDRDDVRRRIVLTGTGVVTGKDVIAAIDRQAAEGLWQYSVLYETTAVTADPSADELRQIVMHTTDLIEERGPRGPVALVAPADAIFGMGRMYEALADERVITYRVFRTRAEAELWLAAARAPRPRGAD